MGLEEQLITLFLKEEAMFCESFKGVLRVLGVLALCLTFASVLIFVLAGGPREVLQIRAFQRAARPLDRERLLSASVETIKSARTNEISFRVADGSGDLPSEILALGNSTVYVQGDSLTVDLPRKLGYCGFLVRKDGAVWRLEWHDEGHLVPLAEMKDELADRTPEVASTEDGEPEG